MPKPINKKKGQGDAIGKIIRIVTANREGRSGKQSGNKNVRNKNSPQIACDRKAPGSQ